MNVHDIANGALFLVLGVPVVIAQAADPASGVTSSLVQIGSVGVVMAWLTMIHLPAQSKAAEKREEAAEKREHAWRSSLEAQFSRAETERARLTAEHEKTMMRVADVLDKFKDAQGEVARATLALAAELREERRSLRTGDGN